MIRLAMVVSMLAVWGVLAQPVAPAEATQPSALAYIQGGNLWVKTLPDGQARQVTSGGNAHGPRWSADGQWVAFHQGDQVWVASRSGGSPRPLHGGAAVAGFAWSPKADTLAFGSGGATYIASAPDWQERALPGVGGLAWSPDGQRLAFVRTTLLGTKAANGAPERAVSLWWASVDGGQPVQVYDAGSPSSFDLKIAGWSPDGEEILAWLDPGFSQSLLADGTPLEAVPAAGGLPRRLSGPMLVYPDFLAASPAGPYLAITEGAGRESWTRKRIAVIDLAAGTDQPLTPTSLAAVQPAWSPDGQRLAYAAAPDISDVGGGDPAKAGLAKRRIWVMNRDGGGQKQLTDDPAYRDERPQWSADGGQLLFARLDQAGQASLWLMHADGGGLAKVVDNLALSNPPPKTLSLGYYGHLNWDDAFAWQPGAAVQLPATGVGGAARDLRGGSVALALALLAGLALVAGRRYERSQPLS